MTAGPTPRLARLVEPPSLSPSEALSFLSRRSREHAFDLLGSGVVHVRPGITCAGFLDVRFEPVSGEASSSPSNRPEAERIRALIDDDYEPIDWQIDFRSGYRWSEATPYLDVQFGHVRGVDVKLPWELGRCQHLPQLGLAAVLAAEDSHDIVRDHTTEFRNQILDFVSANPPRFGVQWVSTMDVAIRVANWLLAWDLLSRAGATWDEPFMAVFVRSLREHGHHIWANLEWSPRRRGNHYLADVAGLVWLGAYLPESAEANAWLRFGARELLTEIPLQFLPDGGSIEGSTSYHRLSVEIAGYSLAILQAAAPSRGSALFGQAAEMYAKSDPLGRPLEPLSPDVGTPGRSPQGMRDATRVLVSARDFTLGVMKDGGRVPQIGDNDNGRFFKLAPSGSFELGDDSDPHARRWNESHLDHRHLVDLIDGLAGAAAATGTELSVDGSLARGLATEALQHPDHIAADAGRTVGTRPDLEAFGRRLAALLPGQVRDLDIEIPRDALSDGTRRLAFPEFGLFVLRSPRLYLSVRCGPTLSGELSGHFHNDQLSIELTVDGDAWIQDPGTFVYTPFPEERDRYRSVRSHFAPQLEGPEPASLNSGLFEVGTGAIATCSYWGADGFAGELRYSDGRVSLCRVEPRDQVIRVTHAAGVGRLVGGGVKGRPWREYLPHTPFSPGYGVAER